MMDKTTEIKGNTINFCIDMDSAFNVLFSEHIVGFFDYGLPDDEKYSLVTAIINFVGHYRNFIWTRYNKYTNFYLYYISSPSSLHVNILKTYKEGIYGRRFFDIALTEQREYYYNNLKILNELAKVLPHVAVLDAGDVDDTLLPYFIIKSKKFDDCMNIIVSNRITAVNNLSYFKNTYVLSARGKNSLISKDLDSVKKLMYSGSWKSMPATISKKEYEWVENYITPLLAIIGYDRFGIPNVGKLRLASALKKIDKAIMQNKLVDSKMPLNIMMKQIGEAGVFTVDDTSTLITNMKLLMYDTIYEKFPRVIINKIMDGVSNLQDRTTVDRINHDYLGGDLKMGMLYAGE